MGHINLSGQISDEITKALLHTTSQSNLAQASIKEETKELLTKTEASITEHVTQEINKSIGSITQDMQKTRVNQINDNQREQFLKSLKFAGMNERRNQVSESDESTFQWIFDLPEADLESEGGTAIESDSEISFDSDDGSNVEKDQESCSSDDDDNERNDYDKEEEDATKDSVASFDNGSDDFRETASQMSTGEQLWDNFLEWLQSDSSIYWISGKAGSGKSTLMKFILSSPQTQSALEKWKPGAKILSHYFWKPGTRMQANMKGLYFTLLHQALSKDSHNLNIILGQDTTLSAKDSDTDWSTNELRLLCQNVLKSYSSPICIFVDGLDEICREDGVIILMEFVKELWEYPNVKVCVSSREEPHLKARLDGNPQLRLQDFTSKDMQRFARNQLRKAHAFDTISIDVQINILDELVWKADGVFLWIVLAVRSLFTGFENADSVDELLARLEILPTDLSRLYTDMWSRLNEGNVLYRNAAAQYFNLAVTSREVDVTIQNLYGGVGAGTWGSLFEIMLATHPAIQAAFLEEQRIVEEEELLQLCIQTRSKILVRCAGILELAPSSKHYAVTCQQQKRLEESINTNVKFIHRTAYDFLLDNEEGQLLRRAKDSSRHELCIRLVKSYLAKVRIASLPFHNIVYQPLLALHTITDPSLESCVQDLLRVCYKWYQLGYLGFDSRALWDKSHEVYPPFLVVAAFPRFKNFILQEIKDSPDSSRLATSVLRNLFTRGLYRPTIPPAMTYFIAPLLDLGADANIKGVFYGPLSEVGYPSQNGQRSYFAVGTAYEQFLRYMVKFPHLCSPATALAESLSHFMKTDPNLDTRTPSLIYFDLESNRMWHSPLVYRGVRDGIYIVMETNLTYMINTLISKTRELNTTASLSKVSDLCQQINPISPEITEKLTTTLCRARFVVVKENQGNRESLYRILDEGFSRILVERCRDLMADNTFHEADERLSDEIGEALSNPNVCEPLNKSVHWYLAQENLGFCATESLSDFLHLSSTT